MLKSYQEFISENHSQEVPERVQQFIDELLDHANNLNWGSFSSRVQNSENNKDIPNTYNDYIRGFTEEYGGDFLEDTVRKYEKQIHTALEPNNNEFRVSEGTFTDVFLHHFASDRYLLGGMDQRDDDDLLVKYLYGWHHTKYGQLALIESFGSIDKFMEALVSNLNDEYSKEYNYYSISDHVECIEDILICKKHGRKSIDKFKSNNMSFDIDVRTFESKFTEYYLVLLMVPFSTFKRDETEKYIVDKLIKNGKKEYLSIFDFDTSHIDDEEIHKLTNTAKTFKRFNI